MNPTKAVADFIVGLLPSGASDLLVGSAAMLGILIALIGVASIATFIAVLITDSEDW